MITESERAYDDFFVHAKLPDAMTRALTEAIARDSEIITALLNVYQKARHTAHDSEQLAAAIKYAGETTAENKKAARKARDLADKTTYIRLVKG